MIAESEQKVRKNTFKEYAFYAEMGLLTLSIESNVTMGTIFLKMAALLNAFWSLNSTAQLQSKREKLTAPPFAGMGSRLLSNSVMTGTLMKKSNVMLIVP